MERLHAPILIGVAGGSGSGKTTLVRGLVEKLGESLTCIVSQDRYYIDQSARFDGDGGSVNFDHPSSLDFDLMALQLADLKKGKTVALPAYDFKTHTRLKEAHALAPARFIFVDGTLILSQPQVRTLLDYCIFIQVSREIRLERRMKRDVQERGRSPEGVLAQFENHVNPMHEQFVEPSKKGALVLDGTHPMEDLIQEALNHLRLESC